MSSVAHKHSLLYERCDVVDTIRQYLISVVAASVITAVLTSLVGKKGAHQTVIKLLCGIFLTITVISPWANIKINDLTGYMNELNIDAGLAVEEGAAMALDASASLIKSKVEAYILDKASSLGLSVSVEVTVGDESPCLPCAVSIHGSAAPFAKQRLQQLIAQDLGISEENQKWT